MQTSGGLKTIALTPSLVTTPTCEPLTGSERNSDHGNWWSFAPPAWTVPIELLALLDLTGSCSQTDPSDQPFKAAPKGAQE